MLNGIPPNSYPLGSSEHTLMYWVKGLKMRSSGMSGGFSSITGDLRGEDTHETTEAIV